jgi:putative transposase
MGMSNYRRNYVPGGTYFLTLVTHERKPLFEAESSRELLRRALRHVKEKRPFTIEAMVLLPDHLHCIWTLPKEDDDYSTRVRQVKECYTREFLKMGGMEGATTTSRLRKAERAVWQRRFWEHTCIDQDDLNRCIDYIHWNPVKHGLVAQVRDYPWSTFHRFVEQEIYPVSWGSENPWPDFDEPEWE